MLIKHSGNLSMLYKWENKAVVSNLKQLVMRRCGGTLIDSPNFEPTGEDYFRTIIYTKMNVYTCCKQSDIKPTFSFYCRWCYNYLQNKYGVDVIDYVIYFDIMYNRIVLVEDCACKSLYEIHNHFLYNLRVTDKQLAVLLETILFWKVLAVNWNRILIFD